MSYRLVLPILLAAGLCPSAPDLPLPRLIAPRNAIISDCDGPLSRVEIDPEVIGYIGPRFERFFIHFDSIQEESRDLAKVFGRIKTGGEIRPFRGTVRRRRKELMEVDSRIEGTLLHNILVFQLTEFRCKSPGKIVGEMSSYSFTFPDGRSTFATVEGVEICGTAVAGNQFLGDWKAIQGKATKIVRWGWRRVPESFGLDCGTTEFAPCQALRDTAWKSYGTWLDCEKRGRQSEASCVAARRTEEWWRPE